VVSLKRNISISFIGNIIYAASKWGILILFTKNLDLASVGEFALGLAITAPVYALSNMQLRGIQATDIHNRIRTSDYVGFRLITITLSLLLIIGILTITQISNGSVIVILLIGIWKGIESLSDILFGYYQKNEEMVLISISLVLKGVLSLVAIAITMIFYKNLLIAIINLILLWVAVVIFFDLNKYINLLKKYSNTCQHLLTFDFVEILNILKLGIPMGIVIMFHNLNMSIPKYFVYSLLGEDMLGIYAAISYAVVAGTTVVGAIGQSSMPRLARYLTQDIVLFKKLVLKVIGASLIVGLCGVAVSIFIGEFILNVLYSEEYSKFNDVFIWTMISATFLYMASSMGCTLTAMRCFKTQASISIFSVLFTALTSYILIPSQGLVGAAISMTIGYFVHAVCSVLAIYFNLKGKSYND